MQYKMEYNFDIYNSHLETLLFVIYKMGMEILFMESIRLLASLPLALSCLSIFMESILIIGYVRLLCIQVGIPRLPNYKLMPLDQLSLLLSQLLSILQLG